MIVLIRNKQNGMEHIENHVIAITLDMYEVAKFKKGAKNVD